MKLLNVPIEEIDLDNPAVSEFVCRYPLSSDDLKGSIREIGLLHPVGLRKKGRHMQIIFGARRILACRELGLPEIPAQLFQADNCTPEKALQMSLAENGWHAPLNAVEKAMVLNNFQILAGWDLARLVHEIAPKLALPKSRTVLNDYLALLRLDEKIKLPVARGVLSPAHGFLFTALRADDRAAIFDEVYSKCQPTLNELRELIQSLEELSALHKTRISELLRQNVLVEVLDDPTKSPRAKCRRVRSELRKMRYPELVKFEDQFTETVESLGLGNSVDVQHAPYFEQNHLRVSLHLANLSEFTKAVNRLEKASGNGGFEKLFRITRGQA